MCEINRFACIDGFAEELDELIYEGFSNWFISFRSIATVYAAHFSYLLVFFAVLVGGLLSLKHAFDNGGKYLQFWWGAMVHGLVSESGLSATKYWHAQAPVMMFGKYLPLHVLVFYPSVLYLSAMAVQKLKLRAYTEPAAIGLLSMLIEIPFRIISVKFLHITYHDSDPSYAARLYGVPWVEIVSSLVFASSYVAMFHGLKIYFLPEAYNKWEPCGLDRRERMLTAAAGVFGSVGGVLQKIFFFHILHDSMRVNPATCLLFLVSVYLTLVFCDEPFPEEEKEQQSTVLLLYHLTILVICLMYLAMLGKPQNEVSIGRHEPTGDCTTMICTRTPIGKGVKRKKYLCADEVADRTDFVYNFDCVPNGAPCLNAIWYTICGAPIRDRVDYFLVIFSILLIAIGIFNHSLFELVIWSFHKHELHSSVTSESISETSSEGKRKRTVNFSEPILEKAEVE